MKHKPATDTATLGTERRKWGDIQAVHNEPGAFNFNRILVDNPSG
jgi:hypothetical protein